MPARGGCGRALVAGVPALVVAWCYWVVCSLVGITNTWVVLLAVVIV
jgi:hypothetical protein